MLIIFPASYESLLKPDEAFADLCEAAKKEHLVTFIDLNALSNNELEKIASYLQKGNGDAIYIGWMLTPEQYEKLFNLLWSYGWNLVNTPKQYISCHYFNGWYDKLSDLTPKSITEPVKDAPDIDNICSRLSDEFGDSAVIVKDFVKTQKHLWRDACFIYKASNKNAVTTVVNNFWKAQNDYGTFTGELVFRKFIPLKYIGEHPKSALPLGNEYRYFVYNGKIISCGQYWDENADYSKGTLPPDSLVEEVIKRINSNFFTVDVAETATGEWIVIEVGDAQVSSLPKTNSKDLFFEKLR